MIDIYLDYVNEAQRELTFAFEGLADNHVWKRPAEGLPSIGEIAGHIVYWEVRRLGADNGAWPDFTKCVVQSPFLNEHFDYYPTTLASSPSPEHLAMTAQQIAAEVARVHEEALAHFKTLNPDLDSTPPGMEGWTWRKSLQYLAFHIAYHTGQIYTTRHLLGETTPDN
jgi:uncharacterized damage-inducible protein DinB